MKKKPATKKPAAGLPLPSSSSSDLFALKPAEYLDQAIESQFHLLKKGVICSTDYRAQKRDPLELVLHATDGFVPLWEENMLLRWRFDETALSPYQDPEAIRSRIRSLLTRAILAWGDAAPIRFDENPDNSDFQIVVERFENCNPMGCTLARAFFPDSGRHRLSIFPTMFQQSEGEQVETLTHEIGHIFGLRHYFAQEREAWPSELFGKHKELSIMNYGHLSKLTPTDKDDLKSLYRGAWNGTLTKINQTPIKLVRPFHYFGS